MGFRDRALSYGNDCLAVGIRRIDETLADRLRCGHGEHACASYDEVADCGSHEVDLVFGRDGVSSECKATGERECVVGEVADHSAVNEPVLLVDFRTILEKDFRATRPDLAKLGTDPFREGLSIEDTVRDGSEVGMRR